MLATDSRRLVAVTWTIAAWVGIGVVLGVIVVLLNTPTSPKAPTTVQPPTEAGQVVTVRVEGASSGGSLPPAVVGGIAGGLIGIVGAVSAQFVNGRIERGQRTDDRRLNRLDSLKDAIDALDAAYMADDTQAVPDAASIDSFLAAERKFRRTVALIDNDKIRELAETCHAKMLSYALTRSEPDEQGATVQAVQTAQTQLFDAILGATLRMR